MNHYTNSKLAVGREKLLTCINKLSDEDKTLIHLRFANEMRFRDIAGLLGITEEATKQRGQRILKKLRQFYYEQKKKNICSVNNLVSLEINTSFLGRIRYR